MAVSRAMRRLLRVLQLEEEQCQSALESALGELQNLRRAVDAATERDRGGRRLVVSSAHSGELTDRLAGLEETRGAARRVAALRPWIQEAEQETAALRAVFLAKRIERRQAETLIQEAEAEEAVEAKRRGQQALDEWHLNRLHRIAAQAKAADDNEGRMPETPRPDCPRSESLARASANPEPEVLDACGRKLSGNLRRLI